MESQLLSAEHSAYKETKITSGVIKINYRFDIGSKVTNLSEAARILKINLSNKQKITKRNADDVRDELQFIEPPLFEDVNCRQFSFGEYTSKEVVLFLLYPDGFVEIEFSIEIKKDTSLERLRDLVAIISKDSAKMEREACSIATSESEKIKLLVSDSRIPSKSEDFIAIFISTLHKGEEIISNVKHAIREHKQIFTQMLMQVGGENLSNSLINKHMRRAIYYTADSAILIGFEGAIYIGEDNIDEANVVDVVNIHRLDLRVNLEFLKTQATVLNQLFNDVTHRHKLSRKERKKLDEILKQISQAKTRARHVISQVADPLLLIEDDYLASVYKAAARIFGLSSLINRIEKRIHELSELEERLNEIRMHQHGSTLEWIVIWLIVIEVVPTVLKWFHGFGNIVFGEHWIQHVGGSVLENIIQIIINAH